MSRRLLSTEVRSLGGGRVHERVRGGSGNWLGILAMSLALSSVWAAGSMAQTEPNPRIDPGIPSEPSGGTPEGWMVLTIPGLPQGAVLGDVWASDDGLVYVWARIPAVGVMGAELDEIGEGERKPTPPGVPRVGSSLLYRFDGTQWTVALETPGEGGVALLGSGRDILFASTESSRGEAQLYRFDGSSWVREVMPGRFAGRLHSLAGVPGDTWFRVGGVILRHDGDGLRVAYELPHGEMPGRGLVYLEASCLFVMGARGHWLLHEGSWSEVPAGLVFGGVEDAWGMRDTQDRLTMYAIGSDNGGGGLQLWRFQETDRATHAGDWSPVFADPPGGFPGPAVGLHLWGVANNEAYAAGVVDGEGYLLRFDGSAWVRLNPPTPLGTVHGAWGTRQGAVWFSTESGSIVRYQRANRAPDLTQAHPSVDRLWPPDLEYVLVDVAGIVDLDGDAVTIEVTRVTQDEALITDDNLAACPDAALSGSHAYLRAEHAAGGDGRTYTIEYTATDRLGATSSGQVLVCAPHFWSTPCSPDPGTFNSVAPCPIVEVERGPLETDAMSGALRIRYELERAGPIHLAVYDVAGRLRATVAEGMQGPGIHETWWNPDRLDAGVYFVRLRGRGPALVRRVIVRH